MIILKNYFKEILKEKINQDIWFHGSSDGRYISQNGFEKKTLTVDYVTDPDKMFKLQDELNKAHKTDEKKYFELLNNVVDLKQDYTFEKPIFLTNKIQVANSYADLKNAFDYQNSEPKVFRVLTNCNKIVKINAFNQRFRFININSVKQGFIDAGISEQNIDMAIKMFNYYISDDKGIRTNTIAAIGSFLGFDCIDVIGVLDSYHGGTIPSTVRIILDSSKIKII
jgi:hypothetical protein